MIAMDEATPDLLYQRVAGLIEDQISRGLLKDGDRAPSLRSMARSARVSVATVNQAYLLLERRGRLRARPRSGYFVTSRACDGMEQPSTPTPRRRRPRSVAAEVLDVMLAALSRGDVMALSSAAAPYAGTLNGQLNRLTRQALRAEPGLPNALCVPPGDPALRRAVARRLSLAGAPVDPDAVVITSGTMDAITLALGVLCQPGDAVLVESPTYFGILQGLEHLRLRLVEVANRPGVGIDVDGVARAVQSGEIAAALLMPSFNNPTGALTADADKARLMQVLGDAGVPVIEDDIYGDLHYRGERPRLLAGFPGAAPVITCGSVSKSIALGYRIGWAASPEYAGEISRAKFCTSVACPTLQQRVLARYFEGGGYDRYLRQLRGELSCHNNRYRDAIARWFPPGTRVSNPEGGVVLWVELPEGADGLVLFREALDEGIGIAPGLIFSAGGDYRNYVRLTLGAGWSEAVEAALQRLGRMVAARLGRRTAARDVMDAVT